MASAALIPVSGYLNSSYEPDCDYVDGELQDRNWGERPHSALQAIVASIFYNNRHAWNIIPGIALRIHVGPGRFRVSDICVLRRSDPVDDIVQKAPLICIEVLSPEDRMNRMQERFEDYARMGVENMWLIDPISRHAWTILGDGSQQRVTDAFVVADTPIRIELAEVFAEFDEMQNRA